MCKVKYACVRMNRNRLIICLVESIHMKIMHSIENIAPNELGLCTLSLNSHLAYQTQTSTTGELRIFNADKLKPGLTIRAHDSALSALCFSPNGTLLATASERGTVIRVFCVKNGQRVQEFRRGVKRCVRIASLVFATNGDFLCASSKTETVYIFKIDHKAIKVAERKPTVDVEGEEISKEATNMSKKSKETITPSSTSSSDNTNDFTTDAGSTIGWSGYFSKAVSSYLIPSQVCNVLAQDRAFATAILAQPGLKHVCGLVRLQKELKLLIACEDGFLYFHDFNAERDGQCKLLNVHDLELNITDSMDGIIFPSSSSSSIVQTAKPAVGLVPKSCSQQANDAMKVTAAVSVVIENPNPTPDLSYAGILKGAKSATTLTDSVKFRKLCDAIDTLTKLFDERQFPPVAIAAKD